MKNSGYLMKQKLTIDAYRQAEKDTYIQFMIDTIILTLSDPGAMGNRPFGKTRIDRIIKAWDRIYDEYALALTQDKEADYVQEKMDSKLRAINGSDSFIPFKERYPYLRQLDYRTKSEKKRGV